MNDDVVYETQTVEDGETATKPETDPTKEGFTFLDWYKDGEAFDFFTPIKEDITLTAEWQDPDKEYVTVTFKKDDGSVPATKKIEKGQKVSKPTDPVKAGHTFVGWYTESETEFDFNTPINENITLTAKWSVVSDINARITITKEEGWLESSYIEWSPATSNEIDGYNVYVRETGGEYVKLDDMLVRAYSNTAGGTTIDYYRADALGLKAGKYQMKVVGKVGDTEVEAHAESNTITVKAHTREGYAFENAETGKSASGAYNDDGTLRANAHVVYVTDANKDTVTVTLKDKKGVATQVTGVQNIVTNYKANSQETPIAIRFIGNINDPANMPNGDLYVDDVTAGMTLEGVGNDATCNGFGIVIKNSSYLEVRNLGFMNCNSDEGDDVGLQQDNDHIWVHNCDMFYGHAGSDGDQKKGDGALDTKKSHYVTHSYNHFWDNGKCNLQGANEKDTSDFITYHHNWYDHSDSRHPRVRIATVHVYNNYYDGNAKYGIGATTGASVFAESNYFRSTANMRPMMIAMQGTDSVTGEKSEGTFSGEEGGMIKAFGNHFECPASKTLFLAHGATPTLSLHAGLSSTTDFDAYVVNNRTDKVPDTVKAKLGGATYNNFDTDPNFYDYTPDTAEDAKNNVIKYAGRIDGGDFKYTFDNAKEDGNSDVIDELKTRLTNYKSCLVKAMGSSSADGGDGAGDGNEDDVPTKPTPLPPMEGVVGSLTFTGGSSTPNPVSSGIVFTVSGNGIDFYPSTGKVRVLKMESSTYVKFTLPPTANTYTATVAYFNTNSSTSDLVFKAADNTTEQATIAASAGKQGSSSDLTGTTVNVAVTLKGGTEYTMNKSANTQFGVVSIIITE